MAGSVPEVRDPGIPARTDDLGEGAEDRTVQRAVAQRVTELRA